MIQEEVTVDQLIRSYEQKCVRAIRKDDVKNAEFWARQAECLRVALKEYMDGRK